MPVFHKHGQSHYANLMIQYMVARRLGQDVPELRLSNFDMPYWNIHHPTIPAARNEGTFDYGGTHNFDLARMAYLLNSGLFERISWAGWGQRMEYFPAKETCRRLFVADPELGVSFDSRHVVCPIRGGELLEAWHPLYPLIPVAFYRDMIERLGLTPVFIGQTEPNRYTDALRKAFPRAKFLPTQGPLADFQTIRKAANIILPVSTFAWLAAWFSHAQRIVMPLFGLFYPAADCDLLPLGEPQYEFWRIPQLRACPVEQALNQHALIEGHWTLEPRANLVFWHCPPAG